jgi:ABC transporter substrate binding protein
LPPKRATSTIPIVVAALGNPAALGLSESDFRRPSGNLTGIMPHVRELPAKQLEIAREIVPGAQKIGIVHATSDISISGCACNTHPVVFSQISLCTINCATSAWRAFPPARSPDRLDALVWAVTELSARTARGEPRVGSEASLRPDLRAPRTHTQNRDLRYWFAFGDKAMTVALQAATRDQSRQLNYSTGARPKAVVRDVIFRRTISV